jgi:hypothetical protein
VEQPDRRDRVLAVHVDGTAEGLACCPGPPPHQAGRRPHLNAIQADQAGRVFAAVKTSADETPGATSSDPQVLLLVFKPRSAAWTSTVIGTLADCHTRPQVVLDEEHSVVHVVATGPSTAGCPAPGTAGTIYDKSAPMDDPVFLAGRGTPIIGDAASANTNNPTSTKQSVTGSSGLVVLASNMSTTRYWHADLALEASADTTAPLHTRLPVRDGCQLDAGGADLNRQQRRRRGHGLPGIPTGPRHRLRRRVRHPHLQRHHRRRQNVVHIPGERRGRRRQRVGQGHRVSVDTGSGFADADLHPDRRRHDRRICPYAERRHVEPGRDRGVRR